MNTEEIAETTEETVENVNMFLQFIEDHIPDMIGFGFKILFAVILIIAGKYIIKQSADLRQELLPVPTQIQG